MQGNLLEYSWIATGVVLTLLAITLLWSVYRHYSQKKSYRLGYLLEAQYQALNSLVQKKPFDKKLEDICYLIESQIEGAFCSVMLRCDDEQVLRAAAGPSLPKSFVSALQMLPIEDGVGACGTAAALEKSVIVKDMRLDERFTDFAELIDTHHLVACWSHPIFHVKEERVIGTFAVYFQHPKLPTKTELEFLIRTRDLVALVMEQKELEEQRERTEQHHKSLFSYNPQPVFTMDIEGRFISINRAGCELLKLPEDELIGQHYELAVVETDRARTKEHFEEAKCGNAQSYEIKVIDKLGHIYDLDITNTPIIINGEVTGVHGIARDRTEQRKNEAQLKILESGIESSVNGVVISDALKPGYPVTYINPAFAKLTGYSFSEMVGRSCRILQGKDTDKRTVQEIRRTLKERKQVRTVIKNYRKDGSAFWNELLISPVKSASGQVTHFVGLQSDITDRINKEEALAFNATHDTLTNLPNRKALETHLMKALDDEERAVYVLFIDLDGFKPVNDSLGHYLGDQVLIETAERLKRVVLMPNLLCRFGGDEFVAVITNTSNKEQISSYCQEILSVFEQPFKVEGKSVSLSAAIGVSSNMATFSNPMELIQRADIAMYEAKKRGGNSWLWHESKLDERLSFHVTLRSQIQGAIQKEQFELFYQPIVTAAGRVAGVEALIRWQHPERGYISPADFIPVAERTGQIIPISDWVLRQACRDLEKLKARGVSLVAVNFSPIQFYRDDFIEKVKKTLKSYQVQPGELTAEITENVLMHDTKRITELLEQLRELGMGVAIDDFGSGFASLRYLNSLPVNKLKIDRSFTENINENAQNAAITRGIFKMVKDLHIQVVAEGVETEAEFAFLAEQGCDYMQGYLFCKPKPLDELLSWAERQQSLDNEL
ncbi:bifunctional diguanylate cyclase/phosphodiesterase [Idiomarina sp. X4]|uniref:sensor domain-containing phosphodiesterase n=1 Tax=Idiomarina sp. X4 TaxID=2055892 RepID=UPI000C2914B4|nr:EAL domain-containing protein [Idiomarina sp. X4]ATZ73466.1 bifunctional diguanylate cyclase/phosphodiesterase [Idiomarina sp. X4]